MINPWLSLLVVSLWGHLYVRIVLLFIDLTILWDDYILLQVLVQTHLDLLLIMLDPRVMWHLLLLLDVKKVFLSSIKTDHQILIIWDLHWPLSLLHIINSVLDLHAHLLMVGESGSLFHFTEIELTTTFELFLTDPINFWGFLIESCFIIEYFPMLLWERRELGKLRGGIHTGNTFICEWLNIQVRERDGIWDGCHPLLK